MQVGVLSLEAWSKLAVMCSGLVISFSLNRHICWATSGVLVAILRRRRGGGNCYL